MFKRFRILMNEEGSSPGGGAPAPAESPAASQGAPAVPSVADIQSAVAAQLADFKNGFFADLRKAGALDKSKPSPTAPAAAPVPVEAPAAAVPPGGMTASEVQRMLDRDRAFLRATATAGLSDEQLAFVEETYRAVNPPDPSAWATTFLKNMGIGAKPQQNAPAPAAPAQSPQTPPQTPPFSDKGPAASSAARDPVAILQNDPRKATMADFDRLVAQHGHQKALQMWTENAMAFLKTVKVIPDNRRQR